MSDSLYIYADRQDSGSLVVTVGLMDILKKNIHKVAFFRPIVENENDYDIEFITNHFNLDIPKEDCYGFSIAQAKHIIATFGSDELYQKLIQKFKNLQKRYDFVLCEGIYSDAFGNIVELDINIEIAKNFSSSVLPLINAEDKSNQEVDDAIALQKSLIKKANLIQIATIVNKASFETKKDIYAIPHIKELSKLSLADITQSLNIKKIFYKDEDDARVIEDIKVVALGVDNFLNKIKQNHLLIVPADRTEIILAIISSYYSKNFPKVSGIVFSYGFEPNSEIKNLIKGLENFDLPMLKIDSDTYKTASKISQIKPRLRLSDTKKISLALGAFYKYIDEKAILQKIKINKSDILTPMMFEYRLFEKARQNKKNIVLPESNDERVLRAAEIIINQNIADITFVAKKDEFKQKYKKLGLNLDKAKIVDIEDKNLLDKFASTFYELRKHKGLNYQKAYDAITHPNYFATMMVYLGLADGMVSGASHSTAETVRPALQIIKTKEHTQKVSSIFFMCLDTKVLVFGDCAINQNPSPKELADIAINSALSAEKFDIEPKIAMISYSTGESGSGEDVQKVKEATRILKFTCKNYDVEGPIQFDAAFDEEVAKKKLPNSKVAGKATVFIFPDLNTGNTTYKAVQRSSGAIAIGPVLQGLKKPVNDLSRGCLVKDIVNTIAITAIQAQEI